MKNKSTHGKSLSLKLIQIWEDMLTQGGLSAEVDYRIRKMSSRLSPVVDMVYLKTVKAADIINECIDMTEQLQKQICANGKDIFHILTQLEKIFEGFLRQTYTFRIKAG